MKSGDRIIVVKHSPPACGVPMDRLNQSGTITDIANRGIYRTATIMFDDLESWWVPVDCLKLCIKNKWNPTGYIPRTERLPLP